MNLVTVYPHLTIDEAGQARIGSTRYRVSQLAAEHYHYGWTAEELLRQHLDLRPEEVYSALTYFYDHYDKVVAELKTSLAGINEKRPQQPFSRDELVRRKTLNCSGFHS